MRSTSALLVGLLLLPTLLVIGCNKEEKPDAANENYGAPLAPKKYTPPKGAEKGGGE